MYIIYLQNPSFGTEKKKVPSAAVENIEHTGACLDIVETIAANGLDS